MMKRLLLAAFALLLAPELAPAEAATCRTTAQLERDQCTRRQAGDRERSRQCIDSYLAALDRCEGGGYNPVSPPPPAGRHDPLNPPVARSRPVYPQVNPRPAPIQPRIRPRINPVVPYDRRAGPR